MVEHTTKPAPATPVASSMLVDELPPIVYVTEVLSVDDGATALTLPEVSTDGSWVCAQCTLINHSSFQHCEACGSSKNDNEESSLVKQQVESEQAYVVHETIQLDASREGVVDMGESPFERKMRRRRRRKGRMAAGAVGGAIVGGVLLCGVGAVAGALAGGVLARRTSKRGEQKKDERLAAAAGKS